MIGPNDADEFKNTLKGLSKGEKPSGAMELQARLCAVAHALRVVLAAASSSRHRRSRK